MLIDVGNGLSISIDHIESIEANTDLTCLVHCNYKSYTVQMPRELLVSMIDRDGEKKPMSNVERLLTEIYKNQSTPRP